MKAVGLCENATTVLKPGEQLTNEEVTSSPGEAGAQKENSEINLDS